MTLAEIYAHEYLGKIFYFCLKNTGNEGDAEELSSDITISVLQGLQNNKIPENFSAWVWKIARNRYARWAKHKHRGHELFDSDDLSEHIELCDDTPNVEERMVEDFAEKETLALMRRELSLIRSDHRKLLVAFYIDDKSLPAIAKELSLPLGTVKTRLIQARKILKEGMNMAREFGKLSYRPEHISFVNHVPTPGKRNEPWSLFEKLLPKNILLAAYRSPMTAEELSLELGVALPYLEEEIAVLEKQLLLRKVGKKYESTVPIISREMQRVIYEKQAAIAPLMEKKIEDYLRLRDELYEKNGFRWNLGKQPEEDIRWARLMRAVDVALFYMEVDEDEFTKRPNGGEWDIVGFEEYDGPSFDFVGQHGTYADVYFTQYKFQYRKIQDKTPEQFKESLAYALEAVCEQKEADKDAVDELLGMGYLKEENGNLIPQMMVVDHRFGDIGTKRLPTEDADALMVVWDEILTLVSDFQAFVDENIISKLSSFMGSSFFAVRSCMYNMRGAVLDAALKSGYITYADDDPRFLLGTMITVNRKEA